MAVGAVLASFIGTTGAAMLLIRPLLETNRERKHVAHTVVFFIFIVCNCGGCLLPIGDPPLFLGYLEGVPFLVDAAALAGVAVRQWAVARRISAARWALVLSSRNESATSSATYEHLPPHPNRRLASERAAAARRRAGRGPARSEQAVSRHRLASVDVSCARSCNCAWSAISLWFGDRQIRDDNLFTYGAIIEVAALFVGIFICMQPALQILGDQGQRAGPRRRRPISSGRPAACRACSTTRRPTSCFSKRPSRCRRIRRRDASRRRRSHDSGRDQLGLRVHGRDDLHRQRPEFMVRSIAESSGVKMPSFFGYMVYSFLILLPILALTVWLFLM